MAFLRLVFEDDNQFSDSFGEQVKSPFKSHAEIGIGILKAAKQHQVANVSIKSETPSAQTVIELLCSRFHLVAR